MYFFCIYFILFLLIIIIFLMLLAVIGLRTKEIYGGKIWVDVWWRLEKLNWMILKKKRKKKLRSSCPFLHLVPHNNDDTATFINDLWWSEKSRNKIVQIKGGYQSFFIMFNARIYMQAFNVIVVGALIWIQWAVEVVS